jgi:dihydrofolate synthase/folylpolyglutamate synthase
VDLDYSEAVAYLDSYINYEKLPDYRWTQAAFRLDRMFRMLELLGNPHAKYPCAHVAGTKGKGSTSAFIASVLQAHGKKTGLYLSPHVLDMRERVSVNGQWISEEEFARIMTNLRPVIEQVKKEMVPATFFEILTALAMDHFAREEIDVAVFEVGIGGRLDATNVVTPVVSVITTIGFDHMDKLGNTLTEIAGEKCGIVKPGLPVISAPQLPEALAEIERICAERNSPLKLVGRDIRICASPDAFLTFETEEGKYVSRGLGIEGRRQRENAACALLALEELQKAGIVELEADKVTKGLSCARLPARFQVIPGEPSIVLDGAHNTDSISNLVESLKERAEFSGRRKVAVVGFAGDKELKPCLQILDEVVDEFIFASTSNPRAAQPEKLLEILSEFSDKPARVIDDYREAYLAGLESVGGEGLLLVTGSFYLAGDVASIIIDTGRAAKP